MTRIADVSAHFVAEKRAMRASWATIARMTGCAEVELRRRFEHGGVGMLDDAPAIAASPLDQARAGLMRRGCPPGEALILARMWMANGARRHADDLARGLTHLITAQGACRAAKAWAVDHGVGFSQGFVPTDAGVQRLGVLAGLRGGLSGQGAGE